VAANKHSLIANRTSAVKGLKYWKQKSITQSTQSTPYTPFLEVGVFRVFTVVEKVLTQIID